MCKAPSQQGWPGGRGRVQVCAVGCRRVQWGAGGHGGVQEGTVGCRWAWCSAGGHHGEQVATTGCRWAWRGAGVCGGVQGGTGGHGGVQVGAARCRWPRHSLGEGPTWGGTHMFAVWAQPPPRRTKGTMTRPKPRFCAQHLKRTRGPPGTRTVWEAPSGAGGSSVSRHLGFYDAVMAHGRADDLLPLVLPCG